MMYKNSNGKKLQSCFSMPLCEKHWQEFFGFLHYMAKDPKTDVKKEV